MDTDFSSHPPLSTQTPTYPNGLARDQTQAMETEIQSLQGFTGVCGTKEGRGLEAHNQFVGAEQVCDLSPLQNGEYLQLERCHLARGLDVQNRFKRCLYTCLS